MLMALGQFVFTPTILAHHQLQRQRSWKYADNNVARGRSKKQFIGVDNDDITLQGNIYQEHQLGMRQSIDDLATMADTGNGYMLVDGSGYIYGMYVIDSLDETKTILTELGVSRKIDFTIKLSRVD